LLKQAYFAKKLHFLNFVPRNIFLNYEIKTFMSKNTRYSFLLYFSLLEPFLFYSGVMDQRFCPAKNKSGKFIFLTHAYSNRLKASKLSKMSAIAQFGCCITGFRINSLIVHLLANTSPLTKSFRT
jgi:hypothetical protein